jgi:hypothetical protein
MSNPAGESNDGALRLEVPENVLFEGGAGEKVRRCAACQL